MLRLSVLDCTANDMALSGYTIPFVCGGSKVSLALTLQNAYRALNREKNITVYLFSKFSTWYVAEVPARILFINVFSAHTDLKKWKSDLRKINETTLKLSKSASKKKGMPFIRPNLIKCYV